MLLVEASTLESRSGASGPSWMDSLAALAPATITPRDLPWPTRVLVLDTNYLASTACHLARQASAVPLLHQTMVGGRAQGYIAAHVPEEMPAAIAKVAARLNPQIEELARRIWARELAPRLRVVDLPIREHLDTEVRDVMSNMYARGGDPDDLPTAALARFLAPAVLLSEDGVFRKVGIAVPSSVPAAVQAAASAAVSELAASGGAQAGLIASRVAYDASRACVAATRAHPKAALAFLVAASVAGWVNESRHPGSAKARLERLFAMRTAVSQAAGLAIRGLASVQEEYRGACSAAVSVRRRDHPVLEEAAAAVLSRAGEPLSIDEIRDELGDPHPWSTVVVPHRVSSAELLSKLQMHSAFVEGGLGWSIGRPIF